MNEEKLKILLEWLIRSVPDDSPTGWRHQQLEELLEEVFIDDPEPNKESDDCSHRIITLGSSSRCMHCSKTEEEILGKEKEK